MKIQRAEGREEEGGGGERKGRDREGGEGEEAKRMMRRSIRNKLQVTETLFSVGVFFLVSHLIHILKKSGTGASTRSRRSAGTPTVASLQKTKAFLLDFPQNFSQPASNLRGS